MKRELGDKPITPGFPTGQRLYEVLKANTNLSHLAAEPAADKSQILVPDAGNQVAQVGGDYLGRINDAINAKVDGPSEARVKLISALSDTVGAIGVAHTLMEFRDRRLSRSWEVSTVINPDIRVDFAEADRHKRIVKGGFNFGFAGVVLANPFLRKYIVAGFTLYDEKVRDAVVPTVSFGVAYSSGVNYFKEDEDTRAEAMVALRRYHLPEWKKPFVTEGGMLSMFTSTAELILGSSADVTEAARKVKRAQDPDFKGDPDLAMCLEYAARYNGVFRKLIEAGIVSIFEKSPKHDRKILPFSEEDTREAPGNIFFRLQSSIQNTIGMLEGAKLRRANQLAEEMAYFGMKDFADSVKRVEKNEWDLAAPSRYYESHFTTPTTPTVVYVGGNSNVIMPAPESAGGGFTLPDGFWEAHKNGRQE